MSNLVNSIISRNFVEADSILSETVELIMARKLEEAKKMVAAKIEEQPHSMNRPAARLRLMDIAEMGGSSGLVVPKSNTSEKGDLPSNVKVDKISPEKQSAIDIVTKNTKALIDLKNKGKYKGPIDQAIEEETEELDEARINIVKARIRGGKIQRRKKVSNVPGMTIRGGKLQRMSAAERRRRKLGARKAVRKRAPKMNRALMKRKRSLMKRRALGL